MDALSSMGTMCGYKAVLIAADTLQNFPHAHDRGGHDYARARFGNRRGRGRSASHRHGAQAGSRGFGLRLRPAAKEQVQSLGGRFVELPIEAKDAQDAGGYAKAQDEEFYRRQRELLAKVIAESDVVITAAVVPGKKSPVLVTEEMVKGMAPGSVIVDLAAERGGNCELTNPVKKSSTHGVTIIGYVNFASSVPHHASQMYARNIAAFLQLLVKDGKLQINLEDDIIKSTLLTQGGEVVIPRCANFSLCPRCRPSLKP